MKQQKNVLMRVRFRCGETQGLHVMNLICTYPSKTYVIAAIRKHINKHFEYATEPKLIWFCKSENNGQKTKVEQE